MINVCRTEGGVAVGVGWSTDHVYTRSGKEGLGDKRYIHIIYIYGILPHQAD